MNANQQIPEPATSPIRPVTVRDGKAGLPYSKGLMAQSVMAAGLPPSRAYAVAEAVERSLHEGGRAEVTSAELRDLTESVLEEKVGPRYAANYRRWQYAQERTVPLIVLIGGATGVGKSTVATTVGGRLGIVRIVSTDAIREVMRGIFTKAMMPSIHTSSFDVPSLLPDPPGHEDPVIAGFRQQVQAVSVGIAQILRRAVLEGTDLIVEGAHVLPGSLALPAAHEAIVTQMIITVDDEQIHRSHFAARAADARSRGHSRYLQQFHAIRRVQDYARGQGIAHDVPVVASYSLDATVSRVMELVVAATEAHRAARSDDSAAADCPGDPAPAGSGARSARP